MKKLLLLAAALFAMAAFTDTQEVGELIFNENTQELTCTKGCKCGNACISCSETCRSGGGCGK